MKGWDQSRFDAAMKRYVNASSHTVPESINKKLYYIDRKAIWFTAHADPNRIKASLGQVVKVQVLTRSGRLGFRRELQTVAGRDGAPLLALIINKRRRQAGQPGLEGRAMERAMTKQLNARVRSVNFLRAGWIPAAQKLERIVKGTKSGLPPKPTDVKQYGRPRGDAWPAKTGFKAEGTIINSANAKHDQKDALQKYGAAGLQRAFDDEARDIEKYLEEQLKPDAAKFNRENK